MSFELLVRIRFLKSAVFERMFPVPLSRDDIWAFLREKVDNLGTSDKYLLFAGYQLLDSDDKFNAAWEKCDGRRNAFEIRIAKNSSMWAQFPDSAPPTTSIPAPARQAASSSCTSCSCKDNDSAGHTKSAAPLHPTLTERLSIHPTELLDRCAGATPHYAFVVVGSGYGASIAASRLARAGQNVCLLERGKELRPGEYPNTMETAKSELKITLPDGSFYGPRDGFLDYIVGGQVAVWKGNGLGGGSLVNSNVSIKPEPRIFQQGTWPTAIRNDMNSLDQGYQAAWDVLCPNPYPFQNTQPLAKMAALEKASQGVGPFFECHVNVTFTDRVNDQGVHQPACSLCGDCNTGCNYGSKNTLLMNYLPDARNHGATIVTHVEVESLTRNTSGSGWTVNCTMLSTADGQLIGDGIPFTVIADNVILGAGSIGSTEILLRSKAQTGLVASNMLGKHFGADGDLFGLSYNGTDNVNGIGWGNGLPDEMRTKEGNVGPCILSLIDMRLPTRPVEENFIIEDMAMPGAFSGLLSYLLAGAQELWGVNKDPKGGEPERMARQIQTFLEGPYKGAMRNTLLMGGMAWDAQDGSMAINPATDGITLSWPDAVDPATNKERNIALAACCTNLDSVFIENPWANNPVMDPIPKGKRTAMCVHPLGGCIMADSADQGVTNHKGQVFSGTTGTATYPDLYVLDSAVIPTALGVNPLWTISAVAERAMSIMAQERGWTVSTKPGLSAPTRAKLSSNPALADF